MRHGRLVFSFGVLVCIALAASCREPTQITLRITTSEKCADLTGVQIVVGPDADIAQGRFAKHSPAAVTHDCTASGTTNLIGTLVVTPGQSAGIVIVAAGVTQGGVEGPEPAACADKDSEKHCIIARRSFSFIDHTSLTLPIDLDPLCVGKVCDPASTCFKGSCVNDAVGCQGDACGLPQETGTGSGSDASSSDGAYDADMDGAFADDGSMTDSGAHMDAGSMVDGTVFGMTDGSVPTCLFQPVPPMNMSMWTVCDSSLMDFTTGQDCAGGANPMRACCHCLCQHGGSMNMVVSCDIGQGIGTSCHPSSCMP